MQSLFVRGKLVLVLRDLLIQHRLHLPGTHPGPDHWGGSLSMEAQLLWGESRGVPMLAERYKVSSMS